jgi:preprotein translocase subunit SecG
MLIVLFVVHMLIALALIGVVMLQKSEGGALGMGGGGMSGFMTGRSTANLLTRTTAILAAVFFATSILLVMLSNYYRAPHSIVDEGGPAPTSPLAPAMPMPNITVTPSTAPATPAAPGQPSAPAEPSAPAPSTGPAAPAPPAGPSAPAPSTAPAAPAPPAEPSAPLAR